MPSLERMKYLEEKRNDVIKDVIRNVAESESNINAIKILKKYPQMLDFKYFDDKGQMRPSSNGDYGIIVVRSPFVRDASKHHDKEVCVRVEPVVAMLEEYYGPLGIRVVIGRTVPVSCQGVRETREEDEFETFLSRPPHPRYNEMALKALETIRQSRFDSRSGTSASGIDLKSSSRPLERDHDGGSKSRRTRRRKHNRKTHHKRKHHSRSRSRAARKHKKYSRRH